MSFVFSSQPPEISMNFKNMKLANIFLLYLFSVCDCFFNLKLPIFCVTLNIWFLIFIEYFKVFLGRILTALNNKLFFRSIVWTIIFCFECFEKNCSIVLEKKDMQCFLLGGRGGGGGLGRCRCKMVIRIFQHFSFNPLRDFGKRQKILELFGSPYHN